MHASACPTTQVMTLVKGIAQGNVTIVATIHSPTQYAFSLFDNLMILASGQARLFCIRRTRSRMEVCCIFSKNSLLIGSK